MAGLAVYSNVVHNAKCHGVNARCIVRWCQRTMQSAILSMHSAAWHGVNAQGRVQWCQCTMQSAMLCKLQGAMVSLMLLWLLLSL